MLIRALIMPTGGLILIMKGLTNLLARVGTIIDMDIMHQGCSKMGDTPTTQGPHNINMCTQLPIHHQLIYPITEDIILNLMSLVAIINGAVVKALIATQVVAEDIIIHTSQAINMQL